MTLIIAPILTFAVFSVLSRNANDGTTLDTTRVFTSLSIFALLQEPLSSFIMALSTFTGSIGCFTRIQEFLDTDVRVDSRIKPTQSYDDSSQTSQTASVSRLSDIGAEKKDISATIKPKGDVLFESNAIEVRDGSFGWDKSKEANLSDIDLTVPRGKFTMLVGPVGCGKSTLIKALLGEVATLKGEVRASCAEMAYCDQTPWHMNGTVRESIIALSEVDERWYMSIIRACALVNWSRQTNLR